MKSYIINGPNKGVKGEIKVSKNGLGWKFIFTGILDLKELL